jgi:large subunit ribosomal protein L9
VTATEVGDLLERKGFNVDRRRIDLEGGIKTLGDHQVRVELNPEVIAEITVTVVREE